MALFLLKIPNNARGGRTIVEDRTACIVTAADAAAARVAAVAADEVNPGVWSDALAFELSDALVAKNGIDGTTIWLSATDDTPETWPALP